MWVKKQTVLARKCRTQTLIVNLGVAVADGWGFSRISQVNGLKMSIIGGMHACQYFRSKYRGGYGCVSVCGWGGVCMCVWGGVMCMCAGFVTTRRAATNTIWCF